MRSVLVALYRLCFGGLKSKIVVYARELCYIYFFVVSLWLKSYFLPMNHSKTPICFSSNAKIAVTLTWKGDIDLDLSAFMLSEDGYICDDADFVFYNSNNRSEKFDPNEYFDMDSWLSQTQPVSADGSLVGAVDAEGSQGGSSKECMELDLAKVSDRIRRVIFCASAFLRKSGRDANPTEPAISISSSDCNSTPTVPLDGLETGGYNSVEIFELSRVDDSHWCGSVICAYHEGGLQTLINKYV